MRFWDSSALIPLALPEPATARVRAVLRGDKELTVWWCTSVECASVLARLCRSGDLDEQGVRDAASILRQVLSSAFEVQPVAAVRDRAVTLLRIHPLRAADALQLAAALVWRGDGQERAEFVCLDDRLRQAAAAEGFSVIP